MKLRVVCITGNELRHNFFVSTLAKEFDVLKVFSEKKANVHEKFELSDTDKAIMQKHFELRTASENEYFANTANTDGVAIEHLATGRVNDTDIVEEIIALSPDYIVLFGSSIIKAHLLTAFDTKVINIHLGLSPYYRGSGTNFWPLYYNEPQCVGATIHLASEKVDAGHILYQVRPDVEPGDTIHDFGNKTIQAAVTQLPKIVMAYHDQKIKPVKQNLSMGRVCYRKDLTATAIEVVYKNFENGLVQDYLEFKTEKDTETPIIQPEY